MKKKIKEVKDIENKEATESLDEELMMNLIKDLAWKLSFSYLSANRNKKEILIKLKKLVDTLHNKYVGEI
jgi:hypothetical protein